MSYALLKGCINLGKPASLRKSVQADQSPNFLQFLDVKGVYYLLIQIQLDVETDRLVVWCLTLFSIVFQIYHSGQCTYQAFLEFF